MNDVNCIHNFKFSSLLISQYLFPAGAKFFHGKPVKNIREAAEALHDARAKWEFIGLGLGVDKNELENIGETYSKNDKKLLEMLKIWLNAGDDTTWNTIVQALKTKAVGRNNLAIEIEKKYC